MKIVLIILLVITLICGCRESDQPPANKANNIIDDLGNSFTFQKSPQSIITLAPNLTEMIFDLGLGNKLIGNTLYCNYPDSANLVTKVGDLLTTNYERILELKPDLILLTVEGNSKNVYERLKKLGFKTFVSNPRNFEGIKKTYLDIGKIFKVEKSAESMVKNWEKRINSIINKIDSTKIPTAMFMIDLRPIMLAGKTTYVNEIMTICGLRNIADDSELNYPVFSREDVLQRDPDYIILTEGRNYSIKSFKQTYPEWKDLSSIKNGNVIFIEGDLYFRPGPRFVLAVEDLYSQLNKGGQ